MMHRVLTAASIALCLAAGAASAATVEQVKGRVFVDDGAGFVPFSGGIVKVGDRVKATAGSASINYGGGVVVQVRAGQTVAVSEVYGQGTSNPSGGNNFRNLALALGGTAALFYCLIECDSDENSGNNVFPISP